MIAFYHASADHLTKAKRAQVISQVEGRLRDLTMGALRKRLTENWNLKDGFVTVDFAPFMEDAVARFEQLRQATEMVTTSPDVMSGATVIRGTRVPVHDVGASVKAGFPIERIRKAYPSLERRADPTRIALHRCASSKRPSTGAVPPDRHPGVRATLEA